MRQLIVRSEMECTPVFKTADNCYLELSLYNEDGQPDVELKHVDADRQRERKLSIIGARVIHDNLVYQDWEYTDSEPNHQGQLDAQKAWTRKEVEHLIRQIVSPEKVMQNQEFDRYKENDDYTKDELFHFLEHFDCTPLNALCKYLDSAFVVKRLVPIFDPFNL